MKDLQREILKQVATGAMSAEEGATRLQALESGSAPPSPAAAPTATKEPSIDAVRLVARFGDTEVIGDPSVATAVAEGPHRARQEGGTLVIEQSLLQDDPTTFAFGRPRRLRRILGADLGSRLTVRMNPALVLSAMVQAGNLRISGVNHAISGEVQAGKCVVRDFRGPLHLNVAAGSVQATGRLDAGASSVHCSMGEVRIVLDPSSSVRVHGQSTLGEFEIDGAAGRSELTLGSGAATLECDCTMGNIQIEVG